ncbi:MAG TPA: PIN domain-containing protein [Solirubrobacterales bacterium]|nr:PIN domain-containing protein [Solirubrobacterales bacterium]
MTLVDAGPLVALIDSGEPDHELCVSTLMSLQLPLVTTWAAFTEAMYLVGRAGAWVGQQALCKLVSNADLIIAEHPRQVLPRIAKLMERYADRPMDLADATLVALAEERNTKRIFTLDADFSIYRLHGRAHFELLPASSSSTSQGSSWPRDQPAGTAGRKLREGLPVPAKAGRQTD